MAVKGLSSRWSTWQKALTEDWPRSCFMGCSRPRSVISSCVYRYSLITKMLNTTTILGERWHREQTQLSVHEQKTATDIQGKLTHIWKCMYIYLWTVHGSGSTHSWCVSATHECPWNNNKEKAVVTVWFTPGTTSELSIFCWQWHNLGWTSQPGWRAVNPPHPPPRDLLSATALQS